MKKALHMIVTGHVQGVGFRFFTQRLATEHNIYGWVKNLPDGSVEILAEGSDKPLEMFIQLVKAGASPSSEVEKCEVQEMDWTGSYHKFSIIH